MVLSLIEYEDNVQEVVDKLNACINTMNNFQPASNINFDEVILVGSGIEKVYDSEDNTVTLSASNVMYAIFPAYESLAAGNTVNIFVYQNSAFVRKASAATNATEADGFVTENYTAGASAKVYFAGLNRSLTGLDIGAEYFLSELPGGITKTPPTGTGTIIQRIGKAISSTYLLLKLGETIEQ